MRLRLVPLGTSAGRPTLQRGASALAVAGEGAWVLCDCGEGAQLDPPAQRGLADEQAGVMQVIVSRGSGKES